MLNFKQNSALLKVASTGLFLCMIWASPTHAEENDPPQTVPRDSKPAVVGRTPAAEHNPGEVVDPSSPGANPTGPASRDASPALSAFNRALTTFVNEKVPVNARPTFLQNVLNQVEQLPPDASPRELVSPALRDAQANQQIKPEAANEFLRQLDEAQKLPDANGAFRDALGQMAAKTPGVIVPDSIAERQRQQQGNGQGGNAQNPSLTPEQQEEARRRQEATDRLAAENAALRQQALAGQQGQGKEDGGGQGGGGGGDGGGGGGKGGGGDKGGDDGGGNDRGRLNDQGLRHALESLGVKRPGQNDDKSSSNNGLSELTEALKNKDKGRAASDSKRKSSFLDDDDTKSKPSPSPTPDPSLTQVSEMEPKLPPPPVARSMPNVLPPYFSSAAQALADEAFGGGGGGGGGLGGSTLSGGGAGGMGGMGGGDPGFLGGSGNVFASVGAPDNYMSPKYNYLKFGESDYGGAAGGGGGDSDGASGGDGDGYVYDSKKLASSPTSMEFLPSINDRRYGAPGLMSYVGRVLKERCRDEGRAPGVCARSLSSKRKLEKTAKADGRV